MISRMSVLAIGFSVLVGCGRSDHPTIRRQVFDPKTDASRAEPHSQTSRVAEAQSSVPEPGVAAGLQSNGEKTEVAVASSPQPSDDAVSADRPSPEVPTSIQRSAPLAAPKQADTTQPNSHGVPEQRGRPDAENALGSKAIRPNAHSAEDEKDVRFGGISMVAPTGWIR